MSLSDSFESDKDFQSAKKKLVDEISREPPHRAARRKYGVAEDRVTEDPGRNSDRRDLADASCRPTRDTFTSGILLEDAEPRRHARKAF